MFKPIRLTSKITEKSFITPITVKATLEHVTPATFEFEPGQYVNVLVAVNKLRSYSICSDAKDTKHITLLVSTEKEGLGSSFFRNLQVGQKVEMIGPSGRFYVHTPLPPVVNFFATGTGIAPFLSMFIKLQDLGFSGKAVLYYGIRTEEGLLLENIPFWLDVKIFVSRPKNESLPVGWSIGRVTTVLPQVSDVSAHYYLCGNPNMINEVMASLLSKGISAKYIFSESFTVSKVDESGMVGGVGFEPTTPAM